MGLMILAGLIVVTGLACLGACLWLYIARLKKQQAAQMRYISSLEMAIQRVKNNYEIWLGDIPSGRSRLRYGVKMGED